MKRGGIICFFFVDDIVFAFRKQDTENVTRATSSLKEQFTLKELGELKWFLGIHIFRDRSKRSLWLSQSSYIEKVANEFIPDLNPPRCPQTPMAEEELLPLPAEEEVTDANRTVYQRKIGSILYAAISTRPDIAFAAARLSRFNQRPGQIHQTAADRVILYLYRTRHLCIHYGHQSTVTSLVCASDASFADNTINRKSSQGYIMRACCLEGKQAGYGHYLLHGSRTVGSVPNGEGNDMPSPSIEGIVPRAQRATHYRVR